ncbi:MAG: cyclase family protein [Chloroflexota bacterium]
MPLPDPTEQEIVGWFDSLSNWGRWGPDDQRGTLNLITPDRRRHAAGLVQDGLTVSCAWPISVKEDPDQVHAPRHYMMAAGEGEPAPGSRGRSNSLDVWNIAPHGLTITHLDAPSHTFWRSTPDAPRTMYNGHRADRVRTREGATAGSIELAGDGIVGRGVLLDLPRLRGVGWWPAGTAFHVDELEAAEQAQGVRAGEGDILMIRTGFPKMRTVEGPKWPVAQAGPHPTCLAWFRERGIAVLACDTANDVQPARYPGIGLPVHGIGMAAMGLWLMDNGNYEELTEACARLGRWEFLVTLAVLKLQHGTGSPVNPIALL